MSEQEPPPQGRSIMAWIGIVIGVLLMLLSGGCSLLFLVPFVFDLFTAPVYYGSAFGGFFAILVLGGVPFGLGFLLFWLSRRSGRQPPDDQ